MSQPVGPALPEKKSCIFYKLMVASILQDNKLKIPHKFVKKYGDELSSVATLAVPSGRIWLVELKKENKKMWFDIGWNEFVEHYSIRIGFFLVFGYEGHSHFNVHVYDLTASEINYLSNASLNNSEDSSRDEHVKNVKDGDLAEIMGSRPNCSGPSSLTDKEVDECLDHDMKKNKIFWSEVKVRHQKNDMHDLQATSGSSQDKGIRFSRVELTGTADKGGLRFTNETHQIIEKRKQETEPSKHLELKCFLYRVFLIAFFHPNSLKDIDGHESLGKIEVKKELPSTDSPRKMTRRWRDVTSEERQNAVRAAETFKPDNPYCRITLQPSYVYKGILLHVPRWFTRRYLNEVTGTITLQDSEGKNWPVQCIYGNGNLKFSKGWAEFVMENKLDEGDVCVFELISSEQIVLKVTIFRVLEDAKPVKQL